MPTRRRWLQFSLRGFFVLLTVSAIWLGVLSNRAREQREAVKAIEAAGGVVHYDWEVEFSASVDSLITDRRAEPPGPDWLRRTIGEEYFQEIGMVIFQDIRVTSEPNVLEALPHFRRMPGLRSVRFWHYVSPETRKEFKAALPNCEFYFRFYDDPPQLRRGIRLPE